MSVIRAISWPSRDGGLGTPGTLVHCVFRPVFHFVPSLPPLEAVCVRSLAS